jgi:hypothetical protein
MIKHVAKPDDNITINNIGANLFTTRKKFEKLKNIFLKALSLDEKYQYSLCSYNDCK